MKKKLVRKNTRDLVANRIAALTAQQEKVRSDLAYILAKRRALVARANAVMIARYGRAVADILENPKRRDAKHIRWLRRRVSA